jgi:hypothetical protein
MNIEQECKIINVPGVSNIWYTAMANITLPGQVYTNSIISEDLVSSAPLNYIRPVHDTLAFGSKKNNSDQGTYNEHQLNFDFNQDTASIMKALEKMTNIRQFVIFKDHKGQFRFMSNALITYNTDTGTIVSSGNTPVLLSAKHKSPIYFYTGTKTIAADGTLSFT